MKKRYLVTRIFLCTILLLSHAVFPIPANFSEYSNHKSIIDSVQKDLESCKYQDAMEKLSDPNLQARDWDEEIAYYYRISKTPEKRKQEILHLIEKSYGSEKYLLKAEYAVLDCTPEKSLYWLGRINNKKLSRSWLYYRVLGFIHYQKQDLLASYEKLEQSYVINPKQPAVSFALFRISQQLDNPKNAFQWSRLFLGSAAAKDRFIQMKVRYYSLLDAIRLGKEKYYRYNLLKIRSQNPFQKKENEIVQYLQNTSEESPHLTNAMARHFLLYFPQSRELHQIVLSSCWEMATSCDAKEHLKERAVLFSQEIPPTIQYANYYLEKKKFPYALALLRRAFYLALTQDGLVFRKESLYLLQELYARMARMQDYRAISQLLKLSHKTDKLTFSILKSEVQVNHQNRELLVFALFWAKANKNKKGFAFFETALQERDRRMQSQELLLATRLMKYPEESIRFD
ncbi:MAG: hypothetical protein AAF518_04910 [Spirochaetota bacterium]